MSETKNTIIANIREKESPLIPFLQKEEIEVKFSTMKLVDYLIAGKIAIVMRTMDEFAAELKNKMVYRTAIELKRDFPDPIYIIEGKQSDIPGGASMPAIRAGITYLTVLNRIPIIFTSSTEETGKYIGLLFRQAEFAPDNAESSPQAPQKEEKSRAPYQIEVLTQIPGITAELARDLINRFGSLRAVFAASEHEVQSVKGVGAKKAKALARLIDTMLAKDFATSAK